LDKYLAVLQGSEMNKGNKLNEVLKQRYQIDLLEGRVMPEHLKTVFEYYEDKRAFLRAMLEESEVQSSETYAKAYLISEAARLILREIKPKRTKKRKETK
jgi:hypothetical protein